MEGIVKFCGGVFAACMAVILVRQAKSEIHTVVGVAAFVVSAMYCVSLITDFAATVKDATGKFGIDQNELSAVIKITGICLVCDFSSDFCRESGLCALAGNVELAGKLAIGAVSIPLAVELLEVTVSILGG